MGTFSESQVVHATHADTKKVTANISKYASHMVREPV